MSWRYGLWFHLRLGMYVSGSVWDRLYCTQRPQTDCSTMSGQSKSSPSVVDIQSISNTHFGVCVFYFILYIYISHSYFTSGGCWADRPGRHAGQAQMPGGPGGSATCQMVPGWLSVLLHLSIVIVALWSRENEWMNESNHLIKIQNWFETAAICQL